MKGKKTALREILKKTGRDLFLDAGGNGNIYVAKNVEITVGGGCERYNTFNIPLCEDVICDTKHIRAGSFGKINLPSVYPRGSEEPNLFDRQLGGKYSETIERLQKSGVLEKGLKNGKYVLRLENKGDGRLFLREKESKNGKSVYRNIYDVHCDQSSWISRAENSEYENVTLCVRRDKRKTIQLYSDIEAILEKQD